MSKIFEDLKTRRSRYGLDKESVLSNSEIVALVEEAVQLTPSAFNGQTQRAVVLFGDESDRFWDLTRDELRKVAPAEGFENTINKLNSFKAGQGTILYYIDTKIVKGFQEQFALYADNFPVWAQQENGMLQLVIWSALAGKGVGANIQHYNPVVDEATRAAFDIPSDWQLVAQMPFGKPTDSPAEKELIPANQKVKVIG